MINFDDLPGDIKSKIFKINKDREREEHWELIMTQVKQQPRGERQSLYSLGRDPNDTVSNLRRVLF